MFVTRGQDVVIHLHVIPEEVAVPAHVGEEAAHQSSQVDDVGRLMLDEYYFCLGLADSILIC